MKNKLLKIFCFIFSFLIILGQTDAFAFCFNSVSRHYESVELIQYGDVPLCNSTVTLLNSTDEELSAKQMIVDGLRNINGEININVAKLPAVDLNALYQDIMNSQPELFYVGFEFSYTCDNDGFIDVVYPTYTMREEEINNKKQDYVIELEKIVSKIDESFSDLEKIVYVHDYLCANFSYDESLSVFDAYSFFIGKTGVCQSYTLAFIAIMNQLGIDVGYVASDSMNHIWNVVEVGGYWYHVDATWDDTYKQSVCGQVKHNNLLLSDYGIRSTGHSDWVSNIKTSCIDSKYDAYFWNDIRLPFVWSDEASFCIVDGICYSVDLDSGSLKYIGIDTDWIYSGLAYYNGNLLCGYKECIKVYDTSGVHLYDLKNLGLSGFVYGLNVYDGVLSFAEATKFSSDMQFNRTKHFLKDCMFSVDLSPEIYEGQEIVKDISSSLIEGVDYNVVYYGNIKNGLMLIDIVGIGDYCDKITFSFYICDEYIFVNKNEHINDFLNQSDKSMYYNLISFSGYENIYGTGSVLQKYSIESQELVTSCIFIVKGDLNGDSVCNVLDAAEAERVSNGHTDASIEQIYAANGMISDEIDVSSYQNVVNIALAS